MPPPLATLDPSSRIDKCTNSFPPRTEIPVSNNPINEVEGFDFRRRGEERKKEEGNGRENKQIIARKLMSTLGPSQLFKPNDGDRKEEENGRKRRRVGKTRNKERERKGDRRRQLSSLLRFPGIGCCRCRRASASITGLETVLINPRASAAVPSILFYLHFAPGSIRRMPTLICLGILRRVLSDRLKIPLSLFPSSFLPSNNNVSIEILNRDIIFAVGNFTDGRN